MLKLEITDEDDCGEKRLVTDYLDSVCEARLKERPNLIVPWILMASYLYYKHDFSILSDGFFDLLCKTMLFTHGDIQHRHKYLITPQRLMMGSLYELTEKDYPTLTKNAALTLVYRKYGVALKDTSRIITIMGKQYFDP